MGSIVIPVYKSGISHDGVLAHRTGTTAGVDYELILADDASSDLTSTITERIKGIEIVRADENKGYVINCCNSVCHTRGEVPTVSQ
ncbi:MAG: glycosyltransferase [Haliea sp.]|nr:glycosyltransferase [Haliea sp.]